jgi:uncharacterized protein YbjT (DUF2867 family)
MFLIIGANGNIGSQLVKQLLADNQKVRVLVRDKKKAEAFGDKVEVALGDVGDPASLDKAFQGVSAAFVLTTAEAILQEKNAYDAAKKAGVKHLVKLAAAGATVGSPIKLSDMHGQSEQALKQSGLDYTILESITYMSNTMGSIPTIKGEGKMYGSFKEGRVPFIDTADVAATAAAILKSPASHAGQTYFLTGPEPLTQAQMAEKLSKAIGKEVAYVDIPSSALAENLKKAGFPAWYADDFAKMSDWFATDSAATPSDTVEKITGRKPRTFDAWLTDNAAAFK